MQGFLWGIFGWIIVLRKFHLTIIEGPVRFRGIKREVGFIKTGGQKERFIQVLQPGQVLYGLFCNLSILVGGIRNIGTLEGIAPVPVGRIFQDIFLQGIIPPGCAVGSWMPDFIPAGFIVVIVMKDLSIADGMVSMIMEKTRQGGDSRGLLIGPAQIGKEAIPCRSDTCHKAGPGGPAYRYVAIGTIETGTLLRQTVNVRRLYHGFAITSQFRPQIIHGNKQYIGSFRQLVPSWRSAA
jgi:hypothetical protein